MKKAYVKSQYEGACCYHIARCPISSEKLGVSELMPLFCERTRLIQHGVPHSEQTLASGGEYCGIKCRKKV